MKNTIVLFVFSIVIFFADLSNAREKEFRDINTPFASPKLHRPIIFSGANGDAFSPGTIAVTAGYGLPNWGMTFMKIWESQSGYSAYGFGPLHFRGEYGVTDKIGLGLSINYVTYGVTYSSYYYNSATGKKEAYIERLDARSISIMPRFNLHFAVSEKLDPFCGVAAGYRSNTYKFTSTNPGAVNENEPGIFPVGFETTVGLRYYFSDLVGVYVETGWAKSLIQGGVSVKL